MKTQMPFNNEIEKTKKEIEVLTKKLSFLEELEQKEKAKQLAENLRDWSQNEEMIDQCFTQHGTACNEAAELLEEFSK